MIRTTATIEAADAAIGAIFCGSIVMATDGVKEGTVSGCELVEGILESELVLRIKVESTRLETEGWIIVWLEENERELIGNVCSLDESVTTSEKERLSVGTSGEDSLTIGVNEGDCLTVGVSDEDRIVVDVSEMDPADIEMLKFKIEDVSVMLVEETFKDKNLETEVDLTSWEGSWVLDTIDKADEVIVLVPTSSVLVRIAVEVMSITEYCIDVVAELSISEQGSSR